MFRFGQIFFCIIALTLVAPSAVHANAHCWCRLGPTSSPYKDFGAIATYNTQSGHDGGCSSLCSQTVTGYMASNQAAICQAANFGSVAAYSCVGTRPWQTAWTQTCPAAGAPVGGSLSFYNAGFTDKTVRINSVDVPMNPNTQPNTPISVTPKFTTFFFANPLNFHMQSWTYTVQLYRGNQLVETLSRKSPAVSQLNAVATFTQQPNNFVHGNVWRISWTYGGPNQPSGSTSYSIPP